MDNICISPQTASICRKLILQEIEKDYFLNCLNTQFKKRLSIAMEELLDIDTKSIILKEIKDKCK